MPTTYSPSAPRAASADRCRLVAALGAWSALAFLSGCGTTGGPPPAQGLSGTPIFITCDRPPEIERRVCEKKQGEACKPLYEITCPPPGPPQAPR
jgi:hypothetical protein